MPPPPSDRPPRHPSLRETAARNAATKAGATELPLAEEDAGDAAAAPSPAAPSAAAPSAALPLPAPWESYFDSCIQVACPSRGATFNVYLAGATGPLVLCLHGGGMSGLTWALVAQRVAGRCRIAAPDLRGHGLTTADDESDLSIESMAQDVAALWAALVAGSGSSDPAAPLASAQLPRDQQQQPSDTAPPATVLVGHSMGGAIAVRTAALGVLSSLQGLVVVDLVEGTALESLPYMQAVLARRPQAFPSLHAAVDWAMATGACRSREAAHVALPSMLRQQTGITPSSLATMSKSTTPMPPTTTTTTTTTTSNSNSNSRGSSSDSGSRPPASEAGWTSAGGAELEQGGGDSVQCSQGGVQEGGANAGDPAPIRRTPTPVLSLNKVDALAAAGKYSAFHLGSIAEGSGDDYHDALKREGGGVKQGGVQWEQGTGQAAASGPIGGGGGGRSAAAAAAASTNAAAAAAAAAAAGRSGCSSLPDTVAGGASDGSCFGGREAALAASARAGRPGSRELWVWRTRLEDTVPFWEGWYRGLSSAFLGVAVPKVLILAGTDRLDRSLTVGQMQGKFQLVLLPQAGHAVHEDEPQRVADTLSTFLTRFRVGQAPGDRVVLGRKGRE